MQHIHRQICDLREWEACVITHHRENETLFPWPRKKIRVLTKHPLRFFRRLWHRQLCHRVVPPTFGETKQFLYQVYRFNARVLHIYFGHHAVRWLPVIKACPLPVVVSFHGADAAVGVTRAHLGEVFRHSRLILARSQALLESLSGHGCSTEKLRLHRTGIPLDVWTPPAQARAIPPPRGAWRFVQACRFVEKKGLHTTLRAFAEVAAKYPHATLALIGDGPLRERLAASCRQLGLLGKVAFPGFLMPEQLREAFHSAHAFVHPSVTTADGNQEGVPNSLLEAMATGLPILATRHGGIPEAVDHEFSGFLVAEGDASGLAHAAINLMENPARWHAMSAAAEKAVRERFERGAQTEILERCYDEAGASRHCGKI